VKVVFLWPYFTVSNHYATDIYYTYYRHEIQQPPSPYVSMVSWVMNGLAGRTSKGMIDGNCSSNRTRGTLYRFT
ncbi:MAG: hypothetical protein ACXVDN_12170, partial [Ktedonobacteraceae bacterium]